MNYSIPEQQHRNIPIDELVSQKLRNSMLWMVVGLATTLMTGIALLMNPRWLQFALHNYTILLFAELGLVFFFSARAYRASVTALKAMFFTYSILNGATLVVIALAYNVFALTYAFIGTIAFFISFAIIGSLIKRDLSSFVPYLLAALVAMILVSVAMLFFDLGSVTTLVLGYAGVILFAIFTAVDVNRIKRNIIAVADQDIDILDRVELVGALSLYLDFVNMFLSFLRIFGSRR